MNSENEVFETLADRIKQHTFMNSSSLYQRIDDHSFKRVNRGPQEAVYTLDVEQTTRFSGLIPQLPMCVLDRTFFQGMKETIILVLKENELYAGMFDISEPSRIEWGIFHLNHLGLWERIEEDEEPEISFLSDQILADLRESKRYRLSYVTGALQIVKG